MKQKRKQIEEVELDADFLWELSLMGMPPSVVGALRAAYEKLTPEERQDACKRLDDLIWQHGQEQGASVFVKEVGDGAEEEGLLSVDECLKLIEGMGKKAKRRR